MKRIQPLKTFVLQEKNNGIRLKDFVRLRGGGRGERVKEGDIQTDRQTDRQAGRQRQRETETERQRQREGDRERELLHGIHHYMLT